MELKVPERLPSGSYTGPEESPRVPESRTCTFSGAQEKGALGPSKSGFHPSATACLPRRTVREKKTASSDRCAVKAAWSRSAMLFAKEVSAARTCAASSSRRGVGGEGAVAARTATAIRVKGFIGCLQDARTCSQERRSPIIPIVVRKLVEDGRRWTHRPCLQGGIS